MTERYSFAVPNISVDGSVIWSQDNIDNTTLTDTINEGYVTAEEETQYLSVLDSTGEISLENLNITLTNPKLEVEENPETFITNQEFIQQAPEEGNEQQVVVYSVEGSDELFGIQLAQDEEGNLQKYQFQFRKNKDGQLEAIPETIQLLPMEDEEGIEGNVENLEPHEETVLENENAGVQHSMHIFVQEDHSDEHILPDRNTMGEQQEEIEESTEEMYENGNEEVDIKPGILTLQNVKQEIQEHHHQTESLQEETSESYPEEETADYQQEAPDNIETTNDQTLIDYSEHIDNTSIASEENSNLSDSNEEINVSYTTTDKDHHHEVLEQNFEHIEVNPDMDVNQQEENGQDLEESDIDDNYQIVEGVHITGDVEAATAVQPSEEATAEKTVNNTNILRHALKTNKEMRLKKDNRLYLYVVQHPEKENVESLALGNLCKPLKTNPRSILKSSFQARNENEGVVQTQDDQLMGKRFARCKEAVQARIFHNFINKTTIPQAPVRKDRLPRKQKIKPVERMDEEIVVQEVMVSNNGFVETVGGEGFNKENLEVTEYVVVSDSDDDYDPKRNGSGTSSAKKKKKHKRKKIEITISDESESSVIELDESDEEKQEVENTPTKRRRGRPPKNRPEMTESTESPSKRSRPEPSNPEKPEIPCPKCEKTFPSQNSLKTHLQHHSLQNSLKNALPEYKYKCDACGTTFKNGILLKRHMCSTCTLCKKKFPDQATLNTHKRIHAKEQLLKSTAVPVPVSPKKTGNPGFKPPKKINSLKCKTCSKLCSSLQNLNIHMKTHREYVCATCSSKFLSQLALEKHLRENCVKSPQALRRSVRLTKAAVDGQVKKTNRLTVGESIRVNCDKCAMHFNSLQLLFKHQVKQHGFETPDKSIVQDDNAKKTLHKEKKVHGGIPGAKKLFDAYSELRSQLDL